MGKFALPLRFGLSKTKTESGTTVTGRASTARSSLSGPCKRLTRPIGKSGVPLWTVVVAIGAAALMVDTGLSINSLTPTSFHSAASPNNTQPLNVNATLFYPYLVSPTLYPTPANLTLLNFSQPQLASTVVGAQPTFFLLSTGSTTGNGSDLYLQEGYYEPTLARDLLNGTHCPPGHGKGHGGNSCGPVSPVPVQWSISSTIPGFTNAPIDGDALAVNNTTVVVAAATGGSTSLWLSSNAGENWSLLGSFSGEFPHLALSGSRVLLTTNVSTGADVTSLSLNGSYSTTTTPLNGAGQAIPVLLPNQTEVIAASFPTHASIVALTSTNNGSTFLTHPVANYTNSSTSPIFNSIGGPIGATSLAVPGGIPGQVTAAATDGNLFLLYTTSVNGRMVGESMVSYNAGLNWSGPYFTAPSLGAIQDPVAVSSPEGYVYVTWRENGNGGWRLDQSVYGANGIALQSPTPLPDGNGVAVGSPGLAIDSLLRPLYVWAANTSIGTQGLFTGNFLSLANASSVWEQGVANLQSSEIVGGQTNLSSALLSKLGALTNMAGGGSPSGAIEKIEQDLYPKSTGLPLTLLCDGGSPVCGHVHKGANPAWIVNSTGIMAPQTYFAIYADWALESLGVGVLTPLPGDASNSVDGATLTVTTTVFNPTVAFFNTSYVFPTFSTVTAQLVFCIVNGQLEKEHLPVGNVSSVNKVVSTVGIDGMTFHPAMGLSATTFWATNMSANTQYPWSMTVAGDYRQTEYMIVSDPKAFCGVSDEQVVLSKVTISPSSISVPLSGSFSTVMKMDPNPPYVTNPATGVIHFHWTNTMVPSVFSDVCIQGNGYSCGFLSNGFQFCYGDCSFTGVPLGTYQASGTVQSWPGTPYFPLTNTYLTPALSLGVSYGGNPPTLSDSFSCTIDLQSNPIHIWGAGVAGISASGAVVFWNSTVSSPNAMLRYYAMGTGVNLTLGPTVLSTTSNGSVEYEIPLVALSTLSAYVGIISETKPGQGCITYVTTVTVRFGTPGVVSLQESDLPYDSITKEGGGATVYYTLPRYFADHSQFVNGSLTVTLPDGSQPTVLPGTAFTAGNYGYVSTTVSTLTPNTAYQMSALFNYSQAGTVIPVVGLRSNFVYLKDTSGDGLSDAEKVLGWGVFIPGNGQHATADKDKYATNGLVSDYVEKEFGLNPAYLDSAGSHMLDTWNLTFSLPSVSCPSGFRCWDESGNSNWDPFHFAQTPQGAAPGNPSGNPPGNFTQASAGFNGPDSSPWGSDQLWSYSNLQVLQELIPAEEYAGWLRGVLSNSPGVGPALTVWGKLSWGANPLLTSTPGDGIPDGARVNPLYDEQLQIQLPDTTVYDTSMADGDGLAVGFFANATDACQYPFMTCPAQGSAWTPEFQGYSSEAFFSGSGATIFNYFLTAPVNQEDQTQSVTIQLVANTATCTPASMNLQNPCGSGQNPYQIQQLPITCPTSNVYTFTAYLDMLDPDASTIGSSGVSLSCAGSVSTSVGLDITFLPVVKAKTYLWLPDDNSTLSNLPAGLQRYTGEQDFFMVVANVSSLVSAGVPEPWDLTGTYSVGVTTSPSMVNILIPRGQLLASPIGQQLLLGRTSPFSGISGNLQIWGGSVKSLECYWAASAYQGCGKFSAPPLQMYSPTTLDCTANPSAPNCLAGGVPSNPGLESSCSGCPAPSLQGVLTFNVTSNYDWDALLAGLLVNTTNGVNGTLKDVTWELGTLGLSSAVMSALATSPVFADGGVFGLPISLATPPPPPPPPGCSSIIGCVANTLGGIVAVAGSLVTGLVGIVGVAWSATMAAMAYLNHATHVLATWAENTVTAAQSALVLVGQALEAALQALVAHIVNLVVDALSVAWSEVVLLFEAYANSIVTSWRDAIAAEFTYLNDTSNANAFTALGLASVGLIISFTGLGSIGNLLVQTMEAAVTTLQPVLQFVNIATIMELALKAMNFVGPLSTAEGSVQYLFSAGESAVGGALASLMNSLLGLTQPVSSSASLPGYIPPLSSTVSAVEGSAETPGFASSFIQDVAQLDGSVLDIADLVVPALATAFLGGFIGHDLVKKTGALGTAITEWVFDIVLTIGSWVFYILATTASDMASRVVYDALSLGWAVVSWVLNIVEVLKGEAKTLPLLALYLVDVASNVLDVAASGCDLAGQAGHPCTAP